MLPTKLRRALIRCLLALSVLCVAAPKASATWSIVVIDTYTGEVCIASATCLKGPDLLNLLPVMVVGVGGAAAQSAGDTSGANRFIIWQGLNAGDSPFNILKTLAASDGFHQTRQYGIANMVHGPRTFTGSAAGQAKLGVKDKVGRLKYAIQGNLLAGKSVIRRTESTLLRSHGDLAQRVMLAMEKARDLGGDGRCSCNPIQPPSCGVPPPNFKTSSTIGFIVMSRIGDIDGVCDKPNGCANGDYYLSLNVTPGKTNVDAVTALRSAFDAWRANLAGHPDHLLSTVVPEAEALPADGLTRTTVRVMLRDVDDVPIVDGSSVVDVTTENGTSLTQIGPVIPDGNGGYSFDVIAGTQPGTERYIITADNGVERATLYPYLELRLDTPTGLHSGFDSIYATSQDAIVPFTIDFGSAAAGQPYILLGSQTGTVPGQQLGGLNIPLNFDAFFEFTLLNPGPPVLRGSLGVLDDSGRATANFNTAPLSLGAFAGSRLDWAVITMDGQVAGPVGFDVLP